jgi:hypothetical protein
MTPLAYSVKDAAVAASVSENTIRVAIKTDGSGKIPPLPAKFMGGRRGYVITHKALEAWIDSLPDA